MVEDTLGAHVERLSLWHGFNIELGLTGIVIVAGLGLFAARARVDAVLDRPLFPGSGSAAFDALWAALDRTGDAVASVTRSFSPTRHLAWPLGMLVLLGGSVALSGIALPPQQPGLTRPIDWLLLVGIVAGVIGVVTARSRLAALSLLGLVGFTVALVFFELGAPDVGMTQMLIEVLTVVVASMVLRRLPARFVRPSAPRRWLPLGLALAAGAVAFGGVYALTGRRERSVPGEYYLEQTEATTGAKNIINTIIVEFRGLDTLGELTVLGVGAFSIAAVTATVRLLNPPAPQADTRGNQADILAVADNHIIAATVARAVRPVLIVVSVVLLLRGHLAPGGGFLAALIAGAVLSLGFLVAPSARDAPVHLRYRAIAAAGIALAAGVGVLGFTRGGFLTPLYASVHLGGWEYHFSTSLLFDLGVYLAVFGVLVSAFDRLGADPTPAEPQAAQRESVS